ncbi:hypothetical protein BDQ12DRAFT_682316 [Crucibulum laeve]|uniref:DUF6699 domain-containing protein n=1 Tax=Crucibulum laeve TaxID=68775 RepID=A0A5C3M2X9_9AGAR|nr:hypothetical protein BDQ12DRAFT_682316 [Crucibulum laeve]
MPVSTRKEVRFATSDEFAPSRCSTPSPSPSNSTLSSDGHSSPLRHPTSPLRTPFQRTIPLTQEYVDGYLAITPVLGWTAAGPNFVFNMLDAPTLSGLRLTRSVYESSATVPPLLSLTIRCKYMPWKLIIKPSSGNRYVTVEDVLVKLHELLDRPVTEAEYNREPKDRQRDIAAQYFQRCARSGDEIIITKEEAKGVKRIDFLQGRHRFAGLDNTQEGPHIWRLHVMA